jgi:hypothetical protein
LYGNALYFPFSSPRMDGVTGMAYYSVDQPGIYFIGLLHDGRLVNSQKITIVN